MQPGYGAQPGYGGGVQTVTVMHEQHHPTGYRTMSTTGWCGRSQRIPNPAHPTGSIP